MRTAPRRALVLTLLLTTSPLAASSLAAAEATPEGAKEVAQSFAAYLGQKAIDGGYVAVAPDAEGDAYTVTIDLPKIIADVKKPGDEAEVSAAPITFETEPQDDGTWKVTGDNAPAIKVSQKKPAGEETFSFAFEGYSFEGIYDPKLAAFLSASTKVDKMTMTGTAPDSDFAVEYGPGTATVTGTPAGGGAVTSTVQQSFASVTETITIKGESPMRAVVRTGEVALDAKVDSAKWKPLLDVLGYAVAHPDKNAVEAAELRPLLSAALPVWNGLSGTMRVKDIAVETPIGPFKAATFAQTFGLSGLGKEGYYDLGLKISGLAVPEGIIPAWTKPVLPTDADLSARVAGVDLDAVSRLAIEKLDPKGSDPWPKDVEDQLSAYFKNGPVRVTFKPSTVSAASLKLSIEGDMTVLPEPVEARVIVTADGLDKAMADLQTATDADPNKQQALVVMGVAKAMAKPGEGGTSVWTVEMLKDGSVTVNGQVMQPPKQ